jgi:opacity protein-like surface antigen
MNSKVLLTLVLAGATTSAMAQKPTEGAPHSVEVQLNLNGDANTIVAPSLKYRNFLSKNVAIRFGLGFNGSKEEKTYNQYDTQGTGLPTPPGNTGTEVNKTSSWSVMPGFEYHFAGTDKLSPYAGLMLAIGGGKSTNEWSNFNGEGYSADYLSRNVENPFSSFGVALLAGMDFYVAENLFLGAEFGYLISRQTTKEGTDEQSQNSNGETVTTTKFTPESKGSSRGFGETAAIRLGWRF